jgi:predicted transcriptional regulator
MNSKSKIAFLPIKPEYMAEIISGKKRYEFRRRPISAEVERIILYSTSPVKRIIGIAQVSGVEQDSPTATWAKTKHKAGISYAAYCGYFAGAQNAVAIKLTDVRLFKNPVSPQDIVPNFVVPQSFRYVDDDFVERLSELSDHA